MGAEISPKLKQHIKCWKKVLYKELVDAELDAAKLWCYEKRDVSPYKCPVCPFWHLSSNRWTADWIKHCHKLNTKLKGFACAT